MVEETIQNTMTKESPTRSLKLYRNTTSKGNEYYNWEIKIDSTNLEELKKIDDEMKIKFPSKDGMGVLV